MTLKTKFNDLELAEMLSKAERGEAFADKATACKRKGVMAAFYEFYDTDADVAVRKVAFAINGPVNGDTKHCTDEVGNCGCGHAEQRLMAKLMMSNYKQSEDSRTVLISTYAPCTNCAHAIINAFGMVTTLAYNHITAHDLRGLEILEAAGVGVIEL